MFKTIFKSGFISLLIALIGCGQSSSGALKMKSVFDEKEAEFILQSGTATILGQAYIERENGHLWTAAGHYPNKLIPVTPYTQERMIAIFKNDEEGFLQFEKEKRYIAGSDDEEKLKKYIIKSSVDREGNFEFNNVPAGSYYVLSYVRHGMGQALLHGGDLMKKVTVAENEIKKIQLIKNYKDY
jgi:hypothetical protein